MATAPPATRPVGEGDDYIRDGHSEWMDFDWREHQRWLTVDRRGVKELAEMIRDARC